MHVLLCHETMLGLAGPRVAHPAAILATQKHRCRPGVKATVPALCGRTGPEPPRFEASATGYARRHRPPLAR
jgi:hypothetical protein